MGKSGSLVKTLRVYCITLIPTCVLNPQPGSTFRICVQTERTQAGLSTQAEVFPSHFPSYWPEVLFPFRKLISAWQNGRCCGIQRKRERQIFSSQDAYKVHSSETADAST